MNITLKRMRIVRNSLVVMLIAFTSSVMASKIDFRHVDTKEDWNKVLAESEKTGKPIFIDMYTDWCGWCKHMDKTTFSDDAVAKYLSANFIPSKMDGESSIGRSLVGKYDVSGYPTFLIVDGDANMISNMSGFMEADPFLDKLRKEMTSSSAMDELKQKRAAGKISDAELQELAIMYSDMDNLEEGEDVAQELFAKHDLDKLVDATSAQFLSYYTHTLALSDQKKVVKALESQSTMEQEDFLEILTRNVFRATKANDQTHMDMSMELLLDMSSDESNRKMIEVRSYMIFAQLTEDMDLFATQVVAMKDNNLSDINELTNLTYEILSATNSKAALASCMELSKYLMEEDPDWASNYLMALTLYKHDKVSEAKKFADTAFKKCESDGQRETVKELQDEIAAN